MDMQTLSLCSPVADGYTSEDFLQFNQGSGTSINTHQPVVLSLTTLEYFSPKSVAGRISKYVHAGDPLASSVKWVRGSVRSPLKPGGLSSTGGGKINVNIFKM